jgi:inosine-uridine nucleoside N-ribohydrolase
MFCAFAALVLATGSLLGEEQPKVPVLVDTNIGSAVEDAFALGLVLASPELELVGVTTSGSQADDRAWLVCRFITQCERAGIPVAAGQEPQPEDPLDWQIQYRRHPAAIFNRTLKPVEQPAVVLLHEKLAARKGEITILALGPLTNIARLLKEHPESRPWIKQIVFSGSASADAEAARTVFASGVPLVVVPGEACKDCVFDAAQQEKLFAAHRPLAFQVLNLFELHGQAAPNLFDPVAAAVLIAPQFVTLREATQTVDDTGRLAAGEGPANCRLVTEVKSADLLAWLTERLAKDGEEKLPTPAGNRSKLVERGGFPARVHTFEDYDTDIERRWWMCGKEETDDVPNAGRRACRAVLTEDFDDRQGQTQTMYRAVIFNPVPGPPMGPKTRLTFRYKLIGTSELRVQLYSLSNGYHRYLSLADLPQNEWSQGTVDMTAMRRPDGSGGPLAADERIDDIQFYVDPRATVLIDDVILYDAAAAGEQRPFPRRILFTGWFDTGKQGQEWPGEFEIVPHEQPRTWKYARSVAGESGEHRLRIKLRGPRRLEQETELTFQYRLTGAKGLRVELYREDQPLKLTAELADLKQDDWQTARCRFTLPPGDEEQHADEIRLLVPAGGRVAIDDLLLYVP